MYCKASSPLRKMTSNKEILLSNRILPHIHDGPAETYELGGAGTSFFSQKHPGWNLSRLRHLIQKKLWNTLCSRREVWIDSRRRRSARLGTQRHSGEGGQLPLRGPWNLLALYVCRAQDSWVWKMVNASGKVQTDSTNFLSY